MFWLGMYQGSTWRVFGEIFRKLPPDERTHACHLVETADTMHGGPTEACTKRPHRHSSILVRVSGIVEDVMELVEVFRTGAREA
jgi:hypothetical protein